MAKKAKTSARSKGYRKTVQKKPFLTKKEIIALVAIVVAIALAVILFNLLYDDGSLDVVDGVAQTENLEKLHKELPPPWKCQCLPAPPAWHTAVLPGQKCP